MARLALAVALTAAAGVTTIVTHHRRPAQARPTPASVQSLPLPLPLPLRVRVSRGGDHRLPLLGVKAARSSGSGVTRRPALPRRRPSRPTPSSGTLADVTMYCATGNRNATGRWPRLGDVAVADRSIRFGSRVRIDGDVYNVEDWIGSGSDFDIYGGAGAGCEQRALSFGRRRLRVVVGG